MARPGYALPIPQPHSLCGTALVGAALTTLASKTKFMQFTMPARAKIIGITLNVNQTGGTLGTATLDVLAGSTSLLGTAFDIAALTPGTPVQKEGSNLSAAAAEVAKDVIIGVSVTVSGGSSPTWADVTVQIDWVALGA